LGEGGGEGRAGGGGGGRGGLAELQNVRRATAVRSNAHVGRILGPQHPLRLKISRLKARAHPETESQGIQNPGLPAMGDGGRFPPTRRLTSCLPNSAHQLQRTISTYRFSVSSASPGSRTRLGGFASVLTRGRTATANRQRRPEPRARFRNAQNDVVIGLSVQQQSRVSDTGNNDARVSTSHYREGAGFQAPAILNLATNWAYPRPFAGLSAYAFINELDVTPKWRLPSRSPARQIKFGLGAGQRTSDASNDSIYWRLNLHQRT